MEVFVNNSLLTIEKDFTLFQLLSHLGKEKIQGMAVAVNDEVVLKNEWNVRILCPQDKIIIITATAGG